MLFASAREKGERPADLSDNESFDDNEKKAKELQAEKQSMLGEKRPLDEILSDVNEVALFSELTFCTLSRSLFVFCFCFSLCPSLSFSSFSVSF